MEVTVNALSKGAKAYVRDIIFERLLKEYRSLPCAGEEDKIVNILEGETLDTLKSAIEDYYEAFEERSRIQVNIGVDDYLNIYLQRI